MTEKQKAKQWAYGILDAIVPWIIIGYCISFLLTPVDDCDRSRWDRCGLKVVTDNKTGIEYLVSSGGGIIKRGE